MSLFRRRHTATAEPDEQRDYAMSQLSQVFGWSWTTYAGVNVGPVEAMQHAAVWACVRLLAGTAATLPVDQVRYNGNAREKMSLSQVVASPSGQVRRSAWVYQVLESLLRHGNTYGQVVAVDSQMRPTQIETINATQVQWLANGNLLVPHVDGKPMPLFPTGDLWHIAAYVQAGSPIGLSPVEYGRQSIGGGLAAEKFSSQFFGSGGHPTQHVTVAGPDLGDEGITRLKAKYRHATDNREVFVSGDAIAIKQLQVNPSDSQFLELMRFTCEQVARWFFVPPEMIFAAVSGQSVTYANVSERDLAFLKYSLGYWLAIIEEAWSECLPRPQVVKFNVDGLLRADVKTRTVVNNTRWRAGVLSRNEWRALEDEPPIPDGDSYEVQGKGVTSGGL